MNFRIATGQDIELIRHWYDEKEWMHIYFAAIDFDKVNMQIMEMIENRCTYLCVSGGEVVGGVGGVCMGTQFTNDKIFMTMLLYLKQDYRPCVRDFFISLEVLLTSLGFTKLIISNPAGPNKEKMDRFYGICGFTELETHYVKTL